LSEPVAFDRESAARIAETVRRVAAMPADKQQYASGQRRGGSIVHVVQVETDTPDVNGLVEGHVVIYSTEDGETVDSVAGEDCYIFNLNG
jgi:hypothetical protein